MREDKQEKGTSARRVTRRSGTKLFGAAPRARQAEPISAFDEDSAVGRRDRRQDQHRDEYDERRRDHRDDRRDYRDERDDYRDDRRDYRDDRRDYRDDRRDYRDDRRDYRDDRRDYRDDRRDYRDDRRDYRDDRRDYRDDRRDYRDDRRSAAHNERERAPRHEERRQSQTLRTSPRTADPTELFAHQVIPYVMFWGALFAAVSFILRDLAGLSASAGAFGNWLADFLCRLFGVGAYVLPLFLAVISLRWKRFVRAGVLGKKLFLSAAFLLLLSGIIHVFQDLDRARCITDSALLLSSGQELVGGGLFGGFVGEWLGFCLRLPGTCLLAIPLLIIIGIYLVGLTPGVLYQRVNAKMQMKRTNHREGQGGVLAAQTPPARQALAEAPAEEWKRPQPLSRGAVYDFGEDEHDAVIDDAVLSDTDTDTAMPPLQTKEEHSEKATARRHADVLDLLDIPDDEPEIVETAPSAAAIRETLKARESANRAVDELLRDMAGEAVAAEPVAETSAASTASNAAAEAGNYYAPFALPVRPEPKRSRTEAPDHSHIVIAPHTAEAAASAASTPTEAYPSLRKEEVAVTSAASAAEEETLGNIRQTPYVAPQKEPFFYQEAAPKAPAAAPAPTPAVEAPVSRGDLGSLADLFEDEPEDAAVSDTASVLDELFGEAPEENAVVDEAVVPVATPTVSYTAVAMEEAPTVDAPLANESEADADSDEDEGYFDLGTVHTSAAPAAPEVKAPVAPVFATREPISTYQAPVQPVQPVQPATPARPVPPVQTPRVERPVVQQTPVRDIAPPTPEVVMHEYVRPSVFLLNEDKNVRNNDFYEEIEDTKEILRNTLESFNIHIQDEIAYSHGPSITRYELRPVAGTSVRSVTNRQDDISLNLASSVRIEAPIPGKPAIGVEVPNKVRETVYMRTMLESKEYVNSTDPLEVPLGLDVGGSVRMCNLVKMPHLLVAGTTGSGKSVCINSILVSLIYKTSPRDLRLILIDPKQIEFAPYEHVPHLYMPIVTDMQRAAGALACAVQEMERRFQLIKDVGVRNIESYNEAVANDPDREHLPYMLIVIDEFADLKMSCSNNDPENFTCRLAQKARAAGIHLIIGTQRPSVDVITGKLKTNIPSRIAFMVKQQVDSRTILDVNGAEALTGRGDMLYMATNSQDKAPVRILGAFVSDGELDRVISFVRKNNDPVQYNQAFMDQIEIEMAKAQNNGKKADFDDFGDENDSGEDPKFVEAVKLAIETQKVATSLLQRRLGVGYGRAAKIIDRMEDLGLVSASDGNKPRQILPAAQGYLNHLAAEEDGGTDEFNDYGM